MSNSPRVIDVTDETFDSEVLAASRTAPVVVDFWAAWCGPCRALGPTLEDVVERTPGVRLAKLDVDANQRTMARFGVRGIPAVKAFRDGEVISEFIGLQPRASVERFIAALGPAPAEDLPSDLAGLRAYVQQHPQSVAARRALGRTALRAGLLDEADTALGGAPADPVSDGLRARIALLRSAAPALPGWLSHPDGAGELREMPELITAIRTSDKERRSLLRRVAVGVLAEHDGEDPAIATLRSQLASALF